AVDIEVGLVEMKAVTGLLERGGLHEAAMLHGSFAEERSSSAVKLIGAAFFDDDDGAAAGVAVFRGEDGGDHLGFFDSAEDGIGGVGAARLYAVHAILEIADVTCGVIVDREAAQRAGVG